MTKTQQIEKEIQQLQEKLKEAKKNALILCFECGKRTKAKNLVFIQTHWYESPWGCSGGDTWHWGKGKFTCPKCGKENTLDKNIAWAPKHYPKLDVVQKETEKALSLKYFFKEIQDVYER